MNPTPDPFRMLDPATWAANAVHTAVTVALRDWPQAIGVSALGVTTAATAAYKLRRARHTRLMTGARVLEISCPPEPCPSGALTLWGNLLGLHRPRLTRLLHGRAHVAFEYCFTARRLAIRLWVPGTAPPGMTERAIEAAWPGARVHPLPLPLSPLPPAGPHGAVTGGRLLPARPELLPLRVKHDTDPLRALIGAGTALAEGQGACLQILARPATPCRAARARRRLRALEGKTAHSTKALIFDTLAPRAASSAPELFMDARLAADARAAAAKLAGPLYEAEIRYAATSPHTHPDAHRDPPGGTKDTATARTLAMRILRRTRDAAALAQARGTAHAIASATCVYAERNHLRRRRLRDPAHALSNRAMRRGHLYSLAELAALAHLP